MGFSKQACFSALSNQNPKTLYCCPQDLKWPNFYLSFSYLSDQAMASDLLAMATLAPHVAGLVAEHCPAPRPEDRESCEALRSRRSGDSESGLRPFFQSKKLLI